VEKASWRPYISWMATLKNDLAQHNLTMQDAIELALNKPLWRLTWRWWWLSPKISDVL